MASTKTTAPAANEPKAEVVEVSPMFARVIRAMQDKDNKSTAVKVGVGAAIGAAAVGVYEWLS